ncbi:hypothetical protein BGX26_011345 [Mortierella sp. AD094]|nr:hypothetical protein BGX26_011345 [Mortierella sp. AD094]
MVRNPFSSSSSRLSLVEAVETAYNRLEMARNENDPKKALQLAGEAKSKIKEAEKIFATDRVGSPALDDSIATAYHEHGKLLDKLRFHDKAQKSHSKAKKWGYIHEVSQQTKSSLSADVSHSIGRSVHHLAIMTAIPSLVTQTTIFSTKMWLHRSSKCSA